MKVDVLSTTTDTIGNFEFPTEIRITGIDGEFVDINICDDSCSNFQYTPYLGVEGHGEVKLISDTYSGNKFVKNKTIADEIADEMNRWVINYTSGSLFQVFSSKLFAQGNEYSVCWEVDTRGWTKDMYISFNFELTKELKKVMEHHNNN